MLRLFRLIDLKEKGIADVDALAATSVDDLVDILDISLDEAEKILASAKSIVEARTAQTEKTEDEELSENAAEESVEDENNESETADENADSETESTE